MKVKLTVDVVKKRLKRRLEKIGNTLQVNPKRSQLRQHGRYSVKKKENDAVDHSFDDLEKFARMEGILAENEEMMRDAGWEDCDDDYEE